MKRCRGPWRAGCAFALVLSAANLVGQSAVEAPREEAAGSQLHSRGGTPGLRQIHLDVVALDKAGKPVPGLQAADFQIFDNKRTVPVKSFEAFARNEGGPVEISLVLDAINLSHSSLARAKEQIEGYLRQNGGKLEQPISILVLTDTKPQQKSRTGAEEPSPVMALHQGQAFVRRIPASQDGAALISALDGNAVGLSRILEAQGGEGQSERVQLSLQALNFLATAKTEQAGRKVFVWIGPGWPLLAQTDAKTKEQLFDTVIYFSDLLCDGRITLDMVNPDGIDGGGAHDGSGLPPRQVVNGQAMMGGPRAVPAVASGPMLYEGFLKGVKTAKEADANDLSLQVLAHQTGGSILQARNTVAEEIARCVAEARTFYALTYELPVTGGAEQYHDVAVKLSRSGVEARTAIGFYAK